MTISQDQLKKTAENLSKIPLDNPKMTEEIEKIIQNMGILQEVDTHWVMPTFSVVDAHAVLREDRQTPVTQAHPDELLDCSPQKVAGHQIIIPNIMQ